MCNDLDTLTTIKGHLQSAISVIAATSTCSKNSTADQFIPVVNPAPNENHTKQPRFVSTKKRTANKRWAKPTMDEKGKAQSELNDVAIKVCGKCFKEDDNLRGETEVPWIQCDNCGLWLHMACDQTYAGASLNAIQFDRYLCTTCQKH